MIQLASLLVALAVLVAAAPAHGLVRPLSKVEAAIHEVNPRVSAGNAKRWAVVIRDQARKRRFDPYTLIAIVRGESHFNPGTINANPPREYSVGLAQINVLANNRGCRVQLDSAGCQMVIASLLDGSHNLRTAAGLITKWRDYCRRRTGKPALFARWLSGFQGYDSRPGVSCNMRRDKRGRWRDLPVPKLTRKVMRYRRHLIRHIG